MTDIANWLTDIDGVPIHEEHALPGASEFLSALHEREVPFLVLTNNPTFARHDLSARLASSGLNVPEENIWTSVTTTAIFLTTRSDSRHAYVVGETRLTAALYEHGFVMTNNNPNFMVLDETRTYDIEILTQAIHLTDRGARFIATNPDVTGPSADGPIPAADAVATMITMATGETPYYASEPSPVMLYTGLNRIDVHSGQIALVDDHMNTDILAGMEAGLQACLVLTGSATRENIPESASRPQFIHTSITNVVECVEKSAPVRRG